MTGFEREYSAREAPVPPWFGRVRGTAGYLLSVTFVGSGTPYIELVNALSVNP